MGRQPLWRRVSYLPRISYFKPAGIRLAQLQEICLAIEEAEAIRLKDLEGLEQQECAQRMNISRTTFGRVLVSARRKVADALLNGKSIKIDGGNFEMMPRHFRCVHGHEWHMPLEAITGTMPQNCPTCSTPAIAPIWPVGPVEGKTGQGKLHAKGNNWK
jgi:predicted DNA-binding protein (UPF0251 family)